MKTLSLDEIKSVTFGAIEVNITNDGFCFERMTKRQREVYAGINEFMGTDATFTAGVRLDFITDADSLCFEMGNPGKIEVPGAYDVLIDGVLRSHTIAEDGGSVSVFLGDAYGNKTEKKRVTLALPHAARGILKNVTLENATFIERVKLNGKIVFYGDSITQGHIASFSAYSYVWHLCALAGCDFINQGVGRGFYHPATLDNIPFEPDKVVISYGTNDWAHFEQSPACFEKIVSEYLDKIKEMYPASGVYVISPVYRDNHTGKPLGSLEDVAAVIARQAEKHGFTHISGLSLVPPIKEMYAPDFLHPTDFGMLLYAENLYKIIFNKR